MERLYLFYRRGPQAGQKLALPGEGAFVVGRDPGETELTISDARLSRRHCRLTVYTDKRVVLVEDMGSSNGVYINKQRITKSWLRPGDRLYLGNSILELQARIAHEAPAGATEIADLTGRRRTVRRTPAPAPGPSTSPTAAPQRVPAARSAQAAKTSPEFAAIPTAEPVRGAYGQRAGVTTEQIESLNKAGEASSADLAAGKPVNIDTMVADVLATAPAPEQDRLLGQMIGSYTIEALIGTGMLGKTYRGRHAFMKQAFAIKVMHPGLSSDKETLEHFLHEARTGGSLDHPSIVRVVNAGQIHGQYYLIMEFVDGVALFDIVARKGSLPAIEVLRIGRDLCSALAYAHGRGVKHRNIKPHNVLIGRKGEVLLSDFGFSIVTGGIGSTITTPQQQVAAAAYQAPELLTGREPGTEQSDLYSLGATLYNALTGRPPFQADRIVALVKQVLAYPATPIAELVPGIPEPIVRVIDRAMAKEPELRWHNAAEFARAIETVTRSGTVA